MKRISVACLCLILFGSLTTVALASPPAPQSDGPMKTYVLTSPGGWLLEQDQAVADANGTVLYKHAGSGVGLVQSTNTKFLKSVLGHGAFSFGEEDMVVQWVDPTDDAQSEIDLTDEAVTPGDETFINLQWNVQAVQAAGAWSLGYTGQGVRVAIVDGGIRNTHIDLAANMDNAHSASFVPGFAFNQDVGTFWHGTHVAGIVAAADNGIGTIGVAPGATIIGVKVLHNGSGSFGQVIQGILYASDAIADGGAGADIINMSLGALFARGGGNTGAGALVAAMARSVNYATAHGVLVVCAAGNQGVDLDHATSLIHVPSQSGSAIAIAATGPVGYGVGWPGGATNFRRPASYTNYGNSSTWVAAPGGDDVLPGSAVCSIPRVPSGSVVAPCFVFDLVISTVRGSGASNSSYGFADGTSMAAPVVSAVAALVKQKFPGASVADLKNIIANTADDEGATGHDPFYGRGFVNATRAVTEGGPGSLANRPAGSSDQTARLDMAIAPLPVRGEATVTFTVPSVGRARIDLFDLAGRNVAVLYDGVAVAGTNTVRWNGRGSLGAGAYFARLTVGGEKTDRMLVLLDH